MEYKILVAPTIFHLSKEVNEHLNLGWECQGGPFDGKNCYFQAIILKLKSL